MNVKMAQQKRFHADFVGMFAESQHQSARKRLNSSRRWTQISTQIFAEKSALISERLNQRQSARKERKKYISRRWAGMKAENSC
jgi:hypothetical protein